MQAVQKQPMALLTCCAHAYQCRFALHRSSKMLPWFSPARPWQRAMGLKWMEPENLSALWRPPTSGVPGSCTCRTQLIHYWTRVKVRETGLCSAPDLHLRG